MFDELGDGVFRRRYESLDLNVGVVIGEDGILVIDTRSSEREAAELLDELGRLDRRPVRWVVNTHWHWDHAYGNALFEDVEIWGHELCQIALETRGEEMKASAKGWLPESSHAEIDAVRIVPPNRVFSETASVAIGRAVDLSYHGFGHTDNDIIVTVPDEGVAFFGDLIAEGAPPNFGDSHPVAWPLTLRLASESLPPTIVPGHGDVVDAAFVESQRQELAAVAELATSFVAGEVDIDEAAALGPYDVEVMRVALRRAQAVSA
ncbi:MAG TPA: MBL fold metallo-hydrolase [Acidimicrobiia bacterium]|nr:MBL fold metallo-hydrolase [Acidimicrobiia bacterium]